jgi:hypothetical protein
MIEVTIDTMKYSGKWAEFTFIEGDVFGNKLPFHASSKTYKFWEAIEDADLVDHTLNHGVHGLKVVWEAEGVNLEIASVKKE